MQGDDQSTWMRVGSGLGDVNGEFYPLELDRFDFSKEEARMVKKKCYRDEYDTRYTEHPISASDADI